MAKLGCACWSHVPLCAPRKSGCEGTPTWAIHTATYAGGTQWQMWPTRTPLAICTILAYNRQKSETSPARDGRPRPTVPPGQVCAGGHRPSPSASPTHLCRWHAVAQAHWDSWRIVYTISFARLAVSPNSTDGQGCARVWVTFTTGCALKKWLYVGAPTRPIPTHPLLQGGTQWRKCGPSAHPWLSDICTIGPKPTKVCQQK